MSNCPCGTGKPFSVCCHPYISELSPAPTPESLMRSRFSAYATQHYQYVLSTYANETQLAINAEALAQGDNGTQWIRLQVISASSEATTGVVEFKAFYHAENRFYCMHERSRFVKQDGMWRYFDGDILENTGEIKLGRNDLCFCGSNKKFKRCCQR